MGLQDPEVSESGRVFRPPNEQTKGAARPLFGLAKHDLHSEIELLALLVQVRNCVVRFAGRIAAYQYGEGLRMRLAGFRGIKVSTANFLGEGIEIERDFLQGVLGRAKVRLPALEKALYHRESLRK